MSEIVERDIEYKLYIDNHINNIKQVWLDIQPYLRGKHEIEQTYHKLISEQIRVHDMSKYGSKEFTGYRQYFYPLKNEEKSLYLYEMAWNHHQKYNPHHWEYWVMGDGKCLHMFFRYIIEMVCDWTAMSYKFGDTPSEFYAANADKIKLSNATERVVLDWLPLFSKMLSNNRAIEDMI